MTHSDTERLSYTDLANVADEALLLRIVRRVALVSNRDEIALEPLGWRLDVDALDSLVSTSRSPHLEVTFRYEGCVVEIDGDGMVRVTEESKQ